MQIDPKISMYLNIVYIVLFGISTGALKLTGAVSSDTAVDIVAWAGLGAGIINIILHGQSSSAAGPGTPMLMGVLGKPMAIGFACLLGAGLLMDGTAAFAKPLPKKAAVRVVGPQKLSLDINKLVAQIQAASLQDLQAAKADADGSKDTVASACYGAIIVIVQAQQSAVAAQASLPPVHLFTTFQQARDFVVSLRPGSQVSTACAPLANEVKMDVLNFVAAVTAGTLSLTSFGL